MTSTTFANFLTRKGVYSFNIHDIRKYAAEFDMSERGTDILEEANSTPTIRE